MGLLACPADSRTGREPQNICSSHLPHSYRAVRRYGWCPRMQLTPSARDNHRDQSICFWLPLGENQCYGLAGNHQRPPASIGRIHAPPLPLVYCTWHTTFPSPFAAPHDAQRWLARPGSPPRCSGMGAASNASRRTSKTGRHAWMRPEPLRELTQYETVIPIVIASGWPPWSVPRKPSCSEANSSIR